MDSLQQSTFVMNFAKGGDQNITNMNMLMSSCMQCMHMAELCMKECSTNEECMHCCIAVSEACSAFSRMCSRGVMDRDFVNACIALCEHCCSLCKNGNKPCMKNCETACRAFVTELKKCFC